MIKNSREFKTGVVVIIVIAVFIWGFNFLKGHNIFEGRSDTYFARYVNVQGLNTASPVTVNGFEIGRVVEISFDNDPEKRGELIVEFSIEKPFVFGKKSVAEIYSTSLMGGKSLAIVPSYDSDPVESGDFLMGKIESDIFSSVGEKLNPLQAKLEHVMTSADSLLVNINRILDDESKTHIKNTIASLDATMLSLERLALNSELLIVENRKTFSASMANIENVSRNFSAISDTLANANLGGLISKIDFTMSNLKSITNTINNGKGTIGKLVNDPSVYQNLDKATKELGELLEDLKLHPKRYVHISVFGKKEKEYVKNDSILIEGSGN
ncbi:MlaD family protein [Flavicella sp.]|uniref:MlaD family protein n=1 Tax=Flavicella sp. TaxID=2957742 RepID=UPI0030173804